MFRNCNAQRTDSEGKEPFDWSSYDPSSGRKILNKHRSSKKNSIPNGQVEPKRSEDRDQRESHRDEAKGGTTPKNPPRGSPHQGSEREIKSKDCTP